ncbi:MAG: hypothetical protein MK320_15010, partial [Gammaproteobacteria bacterium]|nr:hypothetical protein [Gammaproteobacteria bacterium]
SPAHDLRALIFYTTLGLISYQFIVLVLAASTLNSLAIVVDRNGPKLYSFPAFRPKFDET